MRKYIGVWLDVRKAILVLFKFDGVGEKANGMEKAHPQIQHIESEVEKKVRLSGGSRTRKTPYGPQNIADDKKLQRRRINELHHYYEKIISKIKDADKILVLGPGEAKSELKKQIDQSQKTLSNKIKLKTADKMTENQMVAEIRTYFEL